MTRKLSVFAAILALAVAALLPHQAQANYTVMCAPEGVAQGANRTIGATYSNTGSVSPIPSGTLYVLNPQGCAPVLAQDVGWFLSQGYTQQGLFSLQFIVPVAATSTTDYVIGTLPPSTYILNVYCSNTDASHGITGGINIGTTSGGSDVVAGANFACGTSSVNFVTAANLDSTKRVFSITAGQTLHANAVTSWNTPTTATITVTYGYF